MFRKRFSARAVLLVVATAIGVSAGGAVAAAPACAADFSIHCGDTSPAFFAHSSHPSTTTFKVTNTGGCDLLVHSREPGESQPTNHTLTAPPHGGSRAGEFTGKFVDFAVICTHGKDPCKGTVTH